MKLWNKPLVYWLRVVHRDLGYLMVGISIVYAVSGMLLNHMDGKDPAFKTTEAEVSLNAGMDVQQLAAAWDARGNLPLLKRHYPSMRTMYALCWKVELECTALLLVWSNMRRMRSAL